MFDDFACDFSWEVLKSTTSASPFMKRFDDLSQTVAKSQRLLQDGHSQSQSLSLQFSVWAASTALDDSK